LRRVSFVLIALVAVAALAALPSSAHRGKNFPKTIALPTGFQPEGIAIHGKTFYVGSIPTGAIFSGSVRTGAGSILVPGVTDGSRAAIGVEFDRRHDRLFVAGGTTGKAFVYDADDGSLIKEYQLTTLSPRFINDVVVTRRGAFFTDSNNQQLYRLSFGPGGSLPTASETLALTGDLSYSAGFNLNGIDATKNGKKLLAVQSNEGKLFRINPRTGVTRELELTGGNVMTGDGILLQGKRLFVVQNTMNQIAVIRVDRRLTKGAIKRLITRDDGVAFDVPTTIDDVGHGTLYAVNARFGVAPADRPTAAYNLVRVDVGNGHKKGKKDDRSGPNRGPG
jgi:outer membrane protein assembly factor BamB